MSKVQLKASRSAEPSTAFSPAGTVTVKRVAKGSGVLGTNSTLAEPIHRHSPGSAGLEGGGRRKRPLLLDRAQGHHRAGEGDGGACVRAHHGVRADGHDREAGGGDRVGGDADRRRRGERLEGLARLRGRCALAPRQEHHRRQGEGAERSDSTLPWVQSSPGSGRRGPRTHSATLQRAGPGDESGCEPDRSAGAPPRASGLSRRERGARCVDRGRSSAAPRRRRRSRRSRDGRRPAPMPTPYATSASFSLTRCPRARASSDRGPSWARIAPLQHPPREPAEQQHHPVERRRPRRPADGHPPRPSPPGRGRGRRAAPGWPRGPRPPISRWRCNRWWWLVQ